MGQNLLKNIKKNLTLLRRRIIRISRKTYRNLHHRMALSARRGIRKTGVEAKKRREAFMAGFRRFLSWETRLADRIGQFVERFDIAHEHAVDKTQKAASEGNRRLRFAKIMLDRKRVQLLKHFAIIMMIAIGVLSLFNYATGYEYSYNGKVLGVVNEQEDVYSVLEVVSRQLSQEHNVEIAIGEADDIEFRKVVTVDRDIDDMEEVLNRLTYMKDINVTGYGIFVDGKRAAVLSSKSQANAVLATLLEQFSEEKSGISYEKVAFNEEVTVEEVATKLGNIQSPSQVREKLIEGEISEKVHVVAGGDTKKSIAAQYGITVAKLEKDNPTIDGEKISQGEQLVIQTSTPVVHVATVERNTYTVKVAYDTVKKDNDNAYVGVNTVKTQGVNGKNKVVARITRINGEETSRDILKTTTVSEPVTKVILIGTKPIPPTMGDGSFINPCPAGRLTSTFGYRWGRMHWGIDLACASGNTIRAADGGIVTFSGWNGAQGYTVKIDHQNGFVTVYAHCSSLKVSVGEKVYEGQTIALSGNTGYTTGPHLHFEVIKNGVHVNPLNYI